MGMVLKSNSRYLVAEAGTVLLISSLSWHLPAIPQQQEVCSKSAVANSLRRTTLFPRLNHVMYHAILLETFRLAEKWRVDLWRVFMVSRTYLFCTGAQFKL